MSGGPAIATTFAVALMIAVLLSSREDRSPLKPQADPSEPEAPPAAIRILRIEQPPQAPPAPPPAVIEPLAPPLESPQQQDVDKGQELLESGRFPTLRATYTRIGFPAYRDAILALGGRFFLYDAQRRIPVAELDPRTGGVDRQVDTHGLSRWPRDVTRHLGRALTQGQLIYGEDVSRVILLPPKALDAALLGTVERVLKQRGVDPLQVTRLDLAYELRDGRLACEVFRVALRDGREDDMELLVDLANVGGVS